MTAVHQSSSVSASLLHGPAGRALRQRRATTSAHPTAAAMAKILAGPAATRPSVRCGAR